MSFYIRDETGQESLSPEVLERLPADDNLFVSVLVAVLNEEFSLSATASNVGDDTDLHENFQIYVDIHNGEFEEAAQLALEINTPRFIFFVGFLIAQGLYQPADADYESVGILPVQGTPHQQAAAFYRVAMQGGNANASRCLAGMIAEGLYQPIDADYASVGLSPFQGELYEQAAVFYRVGIQRGSHIAALGLATLIVEGLYQPTDADYESVGIRSVQGNRYELAAVFYRVGIQRGSGEAAHNLARMIVEGLYQPTDADYESAWIETVHGDRYQQSAAFLRVAMQLGSSEAPAYLGGIVAGGLYQPTDAEYESVGLNRVQGSPFQQSAALCRIGMWRRDVTAVSSLALMIDNGAYDPIDADYESAGIEVVQGNRYQQAAAFYRIGIQRRDVSALNGFVMMISSGAYDPIDADFESAGIEVVRGNRTQKVVVFCRMGMQCGSDEAANLLAGMMDDALYQPTDADYESAGIHPVEGSCYQQAAAFYRVAIQLGSDKAPNNLAGMIQAGLYQPTDADYESVGIHPVEGNRYQQAAAFSRVALQLGHDEAANKIASMIQMGLYQPTDADFECARIEAVQGNHYQQAAAFYQVAIQRGSVHAPNNLAIMISEGLYQPTDVDYENVGIETVQGNRCQEAAAFCRIGIQRGSVEAPNNLARMIEETLYQPTDADYESASIEAVQGNPCQEAAAFYLVGMRRGSNRSPYELAVMVYKGLYQPTDADYESVGMETVQGNRYQEAAAFYRVGMHRGSAASASNLALMIKKDLYQPTDADYESVGIEAVQGNRYQQAAAFYRIGIQYGSVDAPNNLAVMILNDQYQPTVADYESVRIEAVQGNRYQQAAAFFRVAMESGCAAAAHKLAGMISSALYQPVDADYESARIEPVQGDRHKQAEAFVKAFSKEETG